MDEDVSIVLGLGLLLGFLVISVMCLLILVGKTWGEDRIIQCLEKTNNIEICKQLYKD